MMNPWQKKIAPLTLALLAPALAALTARAESGVQAVLSQDSVSLGGSATLQVTVRGNSLGEQLAVPQVDGLQFEQAGVARSSNLSASFGGGAGGSMTRENIVQVSFRVVPQREGAFTIPPFKCEIDGKTFATQPLTLKALKVTGVTSSGGLSAAPAASTSLPAAEKNDAVFSRLTGVPEKMYAGQVVAATMQLFVNRAANLSIKLNGAPTLQGGDAFAVAAKSGNIAQREETVNGVPYTVAYLTLTLTALKDGDFELSAQWPLMVVTVKDQPAPGVPESFLNNPFFRGMFRQQVEEPLALGGDKQAVKILPLPADGQPASYGGAIGEFTVSVAAEPAEVRVGDPLTLRMEVRGSGNFDRVGAPVFNGSDGWKTYPASARFDAADTLGLEGAKVFSQALIPQNDQIKTLPAVEFSYFDPLTVKYVTLQPKLPPVAVLPAEPNAAMVRHAAPDAASPDHGPATKNPPLAPLRLEEGTVRADLRPVTRAAWFWAANSGSLLLGLAGFFLLRRYRQTLDADYQSRQRTDRNVALALQALDSALANEDSAAFAEAASRALRERLAGVWGLRAESITTADVRHRLDADGEPALALFEAADAVTYAGRRLSRDEMFNFKQRVVAQLNQLGAAS
ncbi:MAG: BatD family protein [Verrucomicrobiales bacterium]|jgi:hypothetical protein|nr:BatD family protein [Verrucomicrobiales bacterium]